MEASGTRYAQLEEDNRRLSEQLKRVLRDGYLLARIHEKLDTQIRLYQQLYEVGRKFSATMDLPKIAQTATEFVLYGLGFERALVMLRSEEETEFHVQALDGYYDENSRQVVASLSLSKDEPALGPLYSGSGQVTCTLECVEERLRTLAGAFQMAEFVIFPLGGEPQNPLGLLMAGNTPDNLKCYTRIQPESEFIVGLANLASLATTTVNNVNYYASLARLQDERVAILREQLAQVTAAQEEERQRIARELHDGVGPALASMNIRLHTARKLMERDRDAAAGEIEELAELAQTNIQDIRRLIYDLRPAILDELGLIPALKEYVARFEKEHNLQVALSLPDGNERLPAPLETALFRIIQEALANAARHAQARRVELGVAKDSERVSVCVTDDGQGFDVAVALEQARHGGHLGLWSMGERVKQLGGQFKIESASGCGTKLTMNIPLQADFAPFSKEA